MEPGVSPSAPRRPRAGVTALILVAALAAGAGYFLFRKPSASPATHVPAIKAAADAMVPSSPVLLSSKAAIIADRYNCLCGDCSDTLGKCTCARDKGSNEMKATLNRLVEEKKTLSDVDAAMAEKYGAKVLVSGATAPPGTPSVK